MLAAEVREPMSSNLESIRALRQLASQDNFAEEDNRLYPGVQNSIRRARLNAQFRHAVDLLIAAATHRAPRLLAIIDEQINQFDRVALDTEDAEQIGHNFERARDCLGIDSSGGILNRWLYGFDVD